MRVDDSMVRVPELAEIASGHGVQKIGHVSAPWSYARDNIGIADIRPRHSPCEHGPAHIIDVTIPNA